MSQPKTQTASNGQPLHFSIGAIIERDGKYLLLDRVNPPYGFAGVAGHVDEGEDPETALIREMAEESGLHVTNKKLIFEEEILWNFCKSAPAHQWRLYTCEVSGEVVQNKESKSIGWYSKEEIAGMDLEPVWRYWFEKLGIIPVKKKITLCGSMKFFDEMNTLKKELEEKGYIVVAPERFLAKQDDPSVYEDLRNPIWQIKHNAVLAHFRKILWADAILVANYDKNNIPNYIGGNTLLEIAFASWYSKKIYFLNNIPLGVSYREELYGFQPIVLTGDLSKI